MEEKHRQKMVAPILVTVIIVLYYLVYFGVIIALIPFLPLRLILGIIPLLIAVVMIKVCIERIREIKEGEEDDLSQY